LKSWDHDFIIKTLLDAGEIALDFFKKTKNSYKKDGSVVTEADIAVENFLKTKLCSKELAWIGEESSELLSAHQLKNDFRGSGFIIDPIDGTMNYANGLEMWGISIGYFEDGRFSEGAVYLPCCREIFITSKNAVHFLELKEREIISKTELAPFEVDSKEYGAAILSVTQAMAKNEKVQYPGPIHSISSAVYTICKLISGSYCGYIGKLKIWDLAAVFPMCQKLNIEIALLNGGKLDSRINFDQFIFEDQSEIRFSAINRLIFAPEPFIQKLIKDHQ
jgi:myo-inositol-1(or 4)-monophosphatase